jgi:hypothetical protein
MVVCVTEIFIDKALASNTDECIIWPFSTSGPDYLIGRGYPQITRGNINIKVVKMICEKIHGAQPTELHEAAHNCGISICINWKHIEWKIHVDNEADKIIHGTKLYGEECSWAKLSEEDVCEILESTKSQTKIAREYGISQQHVSRIKRGVGWKHILPEPKGPDLFA